MAFFEMSVINEDFKQYLTIGKIGRILLSIVFKITVHCLGVMERFVKSWHKSEAMKQH